MLLSSLPILGPIGRAKKKFFTSSQVLLLVGWSSNISTTKWKKGAWMRDWKTQQLYTTILAHFRRNIHFFAHKKGCHKQWTMTNESSWHYFLPILTPWVALPASHSRTSFTASLRKSQSQWQPLPQRNHKVKQFNRLMRGCLPKWASSCPNTNNAQLLLTLWIAPNGKHPHLYIKPRKLWKLNDIHPCHIGSLALRTGVL